MWARLKSICGVIYDGGASISLWRFPRSRRISCASSRIWIGKTKGLRDSVLSASVVFPKPRALQPVSSVPLSEWLIVHPALIMTYASTQHAYGIALNYTMLQTLQQHIRMLLSRTTNFYWKSVSSFQQITRRFRSSKKIVKWIKWSKRNDSCVAGTKQPGNFLFS